MTTAKNLTALYPQLSAHERVRLTLAAIARGDADDVQRLRRTCPRRVYEQADADYVDVIEATRLVAAQFLALWQEYESSLTLSEVLASSCLDEVVRAKVLQLRSARLHATYDGLVLFCCSVGLTPLEVLSWYPGLLGIVEGVIGTLSENTARDDVHRGAVVALLSSSWPVVFTSDTSEARPRRTDNTSI